MTESRDSFARDHLTRGGWLRVWGPVAIAFVAAVLLYLPMLRHGFVEWDDQATLRDNPSWNPPAAGHVLDYWRQPHLALWIPVTYTAWGLTALGAWDGQQLRAMPFHAMSMLGHAAAAALVALTVGRLLRSDKENAVWPSALAGLVFAVHPVQVDSVAWASGLKDVLAGLFSIVAVLMWVMGEQRRNRLWLVAALGAFVLAMLSKPSATPLPLATIPIGRAFLGLSWRRVLTVAGVGLLLAIPVMIVATLVQPPNDVAPVELWRRPFQAADAAWFYVRHVVWPWPVVVDYGRSAMSGWAYAAIVPLVGIAAVAYWMDRRLLAALGAAVVPLLPVLGFVQFQFQRYSRVADHYLYVPMFFVGLALAVLVRRLQPRVAIRAVCVCWVVVLAGMTAVYLPKWADTMPLFTHNLAVVPDSFAGHRVLATQLARKNDPAAIPHALAAISAHPDDLETTVTLGNLYMRLERYAEAEPLYRRALALRPDLDRVRRALGTSLMLQGKPAEP